MKGRLFGKQVSKQIKQIIFMINPFLSQKQMEKMKEVIGPCCLFRIMLKDNGLELLLNVINFICIYYWCLQKYLDILQESVCVWLMINALIQLNVKQIYDRVQRTFMILDKMHKGSFDSVEDIIRNTQSKETFFILIQTLNMLFMLVAYLLDWTDVQETWLIFQLTYVFKFIVSLLFHNQDMQLNNNIEQMTSKKIQKMNKKTCVICLERFQKYEFIKRLKCHPDHVFHEKCINRWFGRELSCPICRRQAQQFFDE